MACHGAESGDKLALKGKPRVPAGDTYSSGLSFLYTSRMEPTCHGCYEDRVREASAGCGLLPVLPLARRGSQAGCDPLYGPFLPGH